QRLEEQGELAGGKREGAMHFEEEDDGSVQMALRKPARDSNQQRVARSVAPHSGGSITCLHSHGKAFDPNGSNRTPIKWPSTRRDAPRGAAGCEWAWTWATGWARRWARESAPASGRPGKRAVAAGLARQLSRPRRASASGRGT